MGSPSLASALLSQEGQSRSAQDLNALADSLVVIATSYRRGDPAVQQRAAHAAAEALLTAAHPGHLAERRSWLAENTKGIPESRRRLPVPYAGAFDALVRIFEGSPDTGLRGATLYFLTELPDQARVVAFFRDVAASRTDMASTAIRHLSMDLGAAGMTILRRLYDKDAVVDPTAREHLMAIALANGWS
jgi:hypothetical protein